MIDPASSLQDLRARLDGIDDAIHDLLMQRADIVASIAAAKRAGDGQPRLRPGREAEILRRLLARHHGSMPAAALARLQRAILAESVAMQGGVSVAVVGDWGDDLTEFAADHFGCGAQLQTVGTPIEAIEQLDCGTDIAVVPMPAPADVGEAAWWTTLIDPGMPPCHVVGRLPFVLHDRYCPEALLLSANPPDPSGDDVTVFGLSLAAAMSDAELTAALAGVAEVLVTDMQNNEPAALVVAEGFLPDLAVPAGLRLSAVPQRLGAYARSIEASLS